MTFADTCGINLERYQGYCHGDDAGIQDGIRDIHTSYGCCEL